MIAAPHHADPAFAQIHLNAELDRVNRHGYTTLHLATIRQGDGYGGYIHLFEIINHLKADHLPNRIAAIRMFDGLWQVVSWRPVRTDPEMGQ